MNLSTLARSRSRSPIAYARQTLICMPRQGARMASSAARGDASGTAAEQIQVHGNAYWQTSMAETYIGEKFTKTIPARPGAWQTEDFPPTDIQIQRLDHAALEVTDVDRSVRFYRDVLGFQQQARPGFPFGGAWLRAGGLMLHLIQEDPSVDKRVHSRKDCYKNEPEPWYLRRSEHKAFQVANLAAAETTLQRLGIEYHKFIVPGTSAAQIFLFDPDMNGIELGEGYAEIAEHLIGKQEQE